MLDQLTAGGRRSLAGGDGRSSPVLATIFFGANDAAGPKSPQYVPLAVRREKRDDGAPFLFRALARNRPQGRPLAQT